MGTIRHTTLERIRMAVEFFYSNPRVTWEQVANHVGVDRGQIHRWRQMEEWELQAREVRESILTDTVHRKALNAWLDLLDDKNPQVVLRSLEHLGFMGAQQLGIKHSGEVGIDIDGLIAAELEKFAARGQTGAAEEATELGVPGQA